MATTAAYSADVWTSSDNVDDEKQWEYSVPIRHDSVNRRSKSRSSRDSANRRDRSSKGSRSSSLSRHVHAREMGFRSSRGWRDNSTSRQASEAESLQDINGYEGTNASAGNVRDSTDTHRQNGSREGSDMKEEGMDNEKWIHRDKLALIESEELQRAAIFFHRRAGVENSRSGRARNHDSHHSGVSSPMTDKMEPWPTLHHEQQEHSSSPTTLYDANGIEIPETERKTWDLRRPEEIAADEVEDSASSMYRIPDLRKSSSRIPISTSSPVTAAAEDDVSTQGTRALTNGDDVGVSIGKPRRASEPIAVESTDSPSPPGGSRPGSRGIQTTQNSPAKKVPSKGPTNRKTSTPATRKPTPRNRTTSSNSQRPTTRSGETRPPAPVNRPEGDPPWLATMYKPDPRLPPDQQILPTHARKMQQEQWEKEGKTPTMYDREFAPLAIGPDGSSRTETKEKEEENEKEDEKEKEEEKPEPTESQQHLTEPEKVLPTSPDSGTRPNTSSGYSAMPKLQEPPQGAPQAGITPKWTPPVVSAQEPPTEKGCGCCIVM